MFHSVTFHGQPNPAFGVNFFSAFSGASACGVIALLISRSGADILSSLKREHQSLDPSTQSLFCAASGIAGGLLLAFGQGMWSQAVIAEVYTLNILFQSLVLAFLYRWMRNPEKTGMVTMRVYIRFRHHQSPNPALYGACNGCRRDLHQPRSLCQTLSLALMLDSRRTHHSGFGDISSHHPPSNHRYPAHDHRRAPHPRALSSARFSHHRIALYLSHRFQQSRRRNPHPCSLDVGRRSRAPWLLVLDRLCPAHSRPHHSPLTQRTHRRHHFPAHLPRSKLLFLHALLFRPKPPHQLGLSSYLGRLHACDHARAIRTS